MATVEEFKIRYPEISGSDEYLELLLQDATADVSPVIFGPQTDRAIYLLAAHMASVTASSQLEGVASVSAGGASISYAQGGSATTQAGLRGSVYGQQYLSFIRQYVGATLA